MAIALEGMKLFERHGARHPRLLAAATAGELSSTHVLSNEFDNAEQYGRFVDELFRDAEMDSFLARINGKDSPLDVESRNLATDIPLDRSGPTTHGSVVEQYVSRLVPGRFERCREVTARAFDFLEHHGATNCRLLQLGQAGGLTDALVASFEFEEMRTRGAAADAIWTDPAGQLIWAVLVGSDSPVTTVSSGIYRDLHV
jgi:hypothetical protein